MPRCRSRCPAQPKTEGAGIHVNETRKFRSCQAATASFSQELSTFDTRSPYGRTSVKQAVKVAPPTVSWHTSTPSAPVQSRSRAPTSSRVSSMHSSAPSAAASSALGPGRTVVATRAPASRAICTDRWPTPPAPACTSANCPALTRARSRRASHAVIVTSGAAAASANDSRSGLRARNCSLTTLISW
jgi:hypothetical protein